jgi:dedicator of cytokinesis protein 3
MLKCVLLTRHVCQVVTLDACLRLHGQLCAEEMLPFQETLEQFFRKNFAPEIRTLGSDGLWDTDYAHSISPSTASTQEVSPIYPPYDKQSISSSRTPFLLPPIQLGRPGMSLPARSFSLRSPRLSIQESIPEGSATVPRSNPLKRQLQHLARHGINGVSSGPASPVSETVRSPDSPSSGSLINVMPTHPGPSAPSFSGPSSLKSRLSRLGSLRLGRRD